MKLKNILDTLKQTRKIDEDKLYYLLTCQKEEAELLYAYARSVVHENFNNKIFVRALVEISSYCKNDCYYCGLRKGNKMAKRYRLSKEEILHCALQAYANGFRTVVLQGGEDGFYDDFKMCDIIASIRANCPDMAITLSLGERSKESYLKMYEAGANRYLLRHESIVEEHYQKLHPQEMSLQNRVQCLYDLKEIGYQVGAGMMIGSPFQKKEDIIEDIRFLQKLNPAMIGIGPYLPHKQTPFNGEEKGDLTLTLNTLAILRLLFPKALIPSTTALATLHPQGRKLGILAGANVVMPNATLIEKRKEYSLYDHKANTGKESVEGIELLKQEMKDIGYEIDFSRGDYKGE